MRCPEPDDIEASLDGAPAPRGGEPIEAHLDECRSCAAKAREVEALDALLMDGLLARDPKAGRVPPRLASRLVAIGRREQQKRAARAAAPGAARTTSGRRPAISARLARPRPARGWAWPLSAAAALAIAVGAAAWLSRPGTERPSGALASSEAARGGDAAASPAGAAAGSDAATQPDSAKRDTPAQATAGAPRPEALAAAGSAREEASARSPGMVAAPEGASEIATARAPAAPSSPWTPAEALPLENEPLGPEETAPALAGPIPAPAAPAPAGGGGRGVVSASPLRKAPAPPATPPRLSIGFEAPAGLLEGALVAGRGEGGRALLAAEAKGDPFCGVRAAVRRPGLFEARRGASIRVSYFVSTAAPLVLALASESHGGALFTAAVEKPVVGKWARATVPLARFRRAADPDEAPAEGLLFGSIEVAAGRPGESLRLIIDDLQVLDAPP
jgi:hypothetical protein